MIGILDAKRTCGDGMEEEAISKSETKCGQQSTVKTRSEHLREKERQLNNYTTTLFQATKQDKLSENVCGLKNLNTKNKLHYLIPKLVKPYKPSNQKSNRKPKFIPFEPYKCATSPLVLPKKVNKIKKNRNNLDINILVSQMSNLKSSELNTEGTKKAETVESIENNEENCKLVKEMEELRKEKDYFQSQLKFQVQVNSELKNLLVAAVGEDMQTKVNVLTEDKLQLARALLDSANNLSTHTEQIEFLAGQCEVWRSKFLASSVMIEELARWKADLSNKNNFLTEASKMMLQLIAQLREMQLDVLKNLKFLAQLKNLNLRSSDVITLTSECLNISQQIVLYSGIGIPENLHVKNLNTMTEAEKVMTEALECVSQPLMSTDDAFRAIVEKAFPVKKSHNNVETSAHKYSDEVNYS